MISEEVIIDYLLMLQVLSKDSEGVYGKAFTFFVSPGVWWSIWTLEPVLICRCLMVSPAFPISFPTIAAAQCALYNPNTCLLIDQGLQERGQRDN